MSNNLSNASPYADPTAPTPLMQKMPVPDMGMSGGGMQKMSMGMSGGRRRRRSVKKSKSNRSSKRRTTRYRKTRGGHKCKLRHYKK
jgi:hypothetical protein